MKVANDMFLIEVDAAQNSTLDIVGLNGSKLVIDTDYNKYKHSKQVGKIYALPMQVTSKYFYDNLLKVGDEVLFHHFVCEPKNHFKNLGNVYQADYNKIYAKIVNNMIEPLEDIIFVDPIKEKEEDLFCDFMKIKAVAGVVKQKGVVFASSNQAKRKGIKAGDIVHFTRDADYEMKLSDKVLYRMRINNIICIERDGNLVSLDNKIMVKADLSFVADDSVIQEQPNHQLQGDVVSVGRLVSDVKVGEIVNFFAPVYGGLEFNGSSFYFVEPRHIAYIKPK